MNSVFCSSCGEAIEILEGGSEEAVKCPQCEQSVEVSSTNSTENEDSAERTPYQIATSGPAEKVPETETVQRSKSFFQRLFHRPNPMDVDVVLTSLIGAMMTFLLYIAVFPLMNGTYLGEVVTKRGWVPYVVVLLTSWSVAMLIQKYSNLHRQSKALKKDLLPRTLSARITPDNVSLFRRGLIEGDAKTFMDSVLVNRILHALQHFAARGQLKDAVDLLNAKSDSDNNAVESSFTMLKLCVWAIPILGFIGTVSGIGHSVGGLSESFESAVSLDAVKSSIGVVTKGLGVAFDNTLLALAMSLLIMFWTSSLQKSEEGFLSSVEHYCNEHLVSRLEGRQIRPVEGDVTSQESIRATIALEMTRHREQLEAAQKKLEEVGRLMTENIVEEGRKMHEGFSKFQTDQIEALSALNLKLVAQFGAGQHELTDRIIQTMGTIAEKVGTGQAQVIEQISNWTQRDNEQRVENIDLETDLLARMRKSLLARRGFKELLEGSDKG